MSRIIYSNLLGDDYGFFRWDFKRKYKLTSNDTQVFAFLYRHCQTFKKGEHYWCGLSNENLAIGTDLPVRTLKQSLQTLRNKGLIFIENPRTGLRKIHLNDSLFMDQEAPSVQEIALTEQNKEKDREIENLKAELERVSAIAKRVKELEAAALPNAYVQRFIEAKYIKTADIPRAVAELNDLYQAFLMEFGISELEYHIDYMLKELASKQESNKPVKNMVSYLARAASERSKQLASKPKQERTPKVWKNPNGKEDWLDRMQRLNQEPDNCDPEEEARLQKELKETMDRIKAEDEAKEKAKKAKELEANTEFEPSKYLKDEDEQLSLFDFLK